MEMRAPPRRDIPNPCHPLTLPGCLPFIHAPHLLIRIPRQSLPMETVQADAQAPERIPAPPAPLVT